MLKELYIENLAVIEKAVIPFSDNFNVFTGETGAGKSILINGINAVLGQRVTRDIVRSGCKKAVITALFTNLNSDIIQKLDELGISHENDEITVTREINSDGGSVARINSRTASVSVLKEIGELLVTIHGQHDNQILLAPERHINVLDSFGETEDMISDYRNDFKRLQSLAKKLENAKKLRIEKRDRIIVLKTRIADLKEADLTQEEYQELENEFRQIQNIDRIIKSLQIVNCILNDDNEENAMDMISKCEDELSGICEYSEELTVLSERLTAAKIDLQDIANELSGVADSFDIDQERFEFVISKYNSLNNLQRKYNCEYSDLLTMYNDSLKELSEMEYSDEDLKKITDEKNALLHQVTDKAKKISSHRKKTAEIFVKKVTEELKFLDMPNVVLDVKHDTGKLTINGMDSIEFLISANRGEKPKPISKIASGGELSRIMLALKSVIADKDSIPTMIFDEIDTGVSGRAAQKIGIKIREISKNRQVLCVTHLSQLAVMADNHLLIEKNTIGDKTVTSVTELDFKGRTKEIARIMGGENPSELILKSAEEELKKAQKI
ncbi:DNA repair protein RecN [Porcipelethomonas sp.]|uniref:DNA repair protein RecN n=1 Tax=Porcipelethomonas sp. TaxID=2981675 RepID=UPI003EFA21A6